MQSSFLGFVVDFSFKKSTGNCQGLIRLLTVKHSLPVSICPLRDLFFIYTFLILYFLRVLQNGERCFT